MRDPNEKYHDHVANIYDDMYRAPYWDFYHDLSWNHMKEYLPKDLSVETHDAGCGTGRFGLRLLKAGFCVFFSDLSARMLHVAQRKAKEAGYEERASFRKMDIADQGAVMDGRFGLVCAQGDPLSLCRDPKKALREFARTLRPGGVAVLSVDNRMGGYEYFLEKADLEGLLDFHKKGILTWLAEKKDERFPCRTFEPRDLEKLAAAAGLEILSLIGKVVLPVRKHPELLKDKEAYRALMRIERKLAGVKANLGRASHLQAVMKRPMS